MAGAAGMSGREFYEGCGECGCDHCAAMAGIGLFTAPAPSTPKLPPRCWELVMLGLPPGPNDRLHYMRRAKLVKLWRRLAAYTARAVGVPPLQRARLSAVIERSRLGIADEDNDRSRLKPVVDGLVDAGVLPKDTRGHVEWGPVTEARGLALVRLTVEALGGAEGTPG